MRVSIHDQIRDYADDVISQSFAVDLDEIMEWQFIVEPDRPVRLAVRPAKVQPQPWLVAVVSAVAVLVLFGSVALVFRLGGPGSSAATTPSTDSLSEWSRIPSDEAIFGGAGEQWMQSVTVGGPGLVAVGEDQTRHFGDDAGDAGAGQAAVWTSTDGIIWSRVPHDEAVFGGVGEEFPTSVIVGGPGLVAVGWDLVPYDGANAAVWTSPDGLTWSRVPHDEAVLGGLSHQAMWGVTVGGPGLVAVGEDRSRDSGDGDVAVWTSPDGTTWSRVPHDEENLGEGRVTSVTSTGSVLVAVGNDGRDGRGEFEGGAAVWTSVDGTSWLRVPHDETVFGGLGGQWMGSVTNGGPGFVAVGADGDNAAVWTSTDGFSWFRLPHDDAVFGGAGEQAMGGVTAMGNRIVAVGFDGDNAAVWTSLDGETWTRVPDDNSVFTAVGMSSVTFGGSGVVAVGGDEDNAAVWLAGPGE